MMLSNNRSWPRWAQTHLASYAPAAGNTDDEQHELSALPESVPADRPRHRSRLAVAAAAAAVLVVAVVTTTLIARVATSSGSADTSPAAAAAAASPTTTDTAGGSCRPVDTARLWRGNGPGSTGTARQAIAGFEHAYYTSRDGELARSFTTDDAAVPGAKEIQRGIDSAVTGQTDYCLEIRPTGQPDTHLVHITVRTGDDTASFDQRITTTRSGGQVLITAITAG